MAITKWIPFGQQGPVVHDTPAVQAVPIPCADGKRFGLENFGNTCYANSVLQALYFCGPFRDLVIQHADFHNLRSLTSQLASPPPHTSAPQHPPIATLPRHKPQRRGTTDSISAHPAAQNGNSTAPSSTSPPTPPIPSSPRTLFSALRSLYIHISQNAADKGTVAPRAFIDKLKELNEAFRNTMHQDAHEFLNYLLNRIVEEIEEEKKNLHANGNGGDNGSASSSVKPKSDLFSSSLTGSTFIHQIFEGILTSETRCLTCEKVSARDESFLDLSIDIEANSSVTACLRQFSASEMLCQRNKFFCDGCCDYQEAEKRMKIKRLPNVLALHLKRFKYQEEVQKYIKLAYRVAFPFELRLFNTVDDAENPDRMYELFAIVVHIGSGPNHGHYVSIIKTMGIWLIFDDETVDTIKENDIHRYFGESNAGSAYVLYYQAVDLDLADVGLQAEPEPAPQAAEANTRDTSASDHSPLATPHINPVVPPGLVQPQESSANARVNGSADHLPHALSPPPHDAPAVVAQHTGGDGDKAPRRTISGMLKIPTPGLGGHGASLPAHAAPTKRPSTATGATRSKTSQESHSPVLRSFAGDAPPSAALPPAAVNGKDKDGKDGKDKEKPGPWYRRKRSFKALKVRPASEAADRAPPVPTDHFTLPVSSQTMRPSTASAHTSGFASRVPMDLGGVGGGGGRERVSGSVAALATLGPRRKVSSSRVEERQMSSNGSHTTSSSSSRSHDGPPIPPLPLPPVGSAPQEHGVNGSASPRALPTIPATPPSATPPSSATGHNSYSSHAGSGSRARDAVPVSSSPPSSFPRIPSPAERAPPERNSTSSSSARRNPLPFGPSPEAKRSSARPSTAGATVGGTGSGSVDRARTSLRALPPLPNLHPQAHPQAQTQGQGPMRGSTYQATAGHDRENAEKTRGSVNLNAAASHGHGHGHGHGHSNSHSHSYNHRHGHEHGRGDGHAYVPAHPPAYDHVQHQDQLVASKHQHQTQQHQQHQNQHQHQHQNQNQHHRIPAPPPPSGDIGGSPLAPNRPSSAHASATPGGGGLSASLGRGVSLGAGTAMGVGAHYGMAGSGGGFGGSGRGFGGGGGGGGGIGASPGANVSTSTTNTFASGSNSHTTASTGGGGGGGIKRTARKLSLTAPFSFGRKK